MKYSIVTELSCVVLQCGGQDGAADEAGGGHPRLRGHHEQQEPQAGQRLSGQPHHQNHRTCC